VYINVDIISSYGLIFVIKEGEGMEVLVVKKEIRYNLSLG